MALASVTKTPAYFSRFQVKYRRRREGKTDYQQRRNLVRQDANKYQTKKYRLVVRITNSRVIAQVAYSTITGDKIVAAANSSELAAYGLPVGLTNYAAAYATGLLVARRALTKLGLDSMITGNTKSDGEEYHVEEEDLERRPFKAVLDIGLVRTTTGARVFGAMKGAVDGGLYVPHSMKRFPGYDSESNQFSGESLRARIFAQHTADYMRSMKEEDIEKYNAHFSRYIKAGITADNLEEKITAVHAAIRANPNLKTRTPKSVTNTREGNFIVTKPANGKEVRYFRPQKLTLAQRKERIQKKIAEIARIAVAAAEE